LASVALEAFNEGLFDAKDQADFEARFLNSKKYGNLKPAQPSSGLPDTSGHTAK
jgi:hypothetical protein